MDVAPLASLTRPPSSLEHFTHYPLTRPNAPKLSAYVDELADIEASSWLSNYGPVNTRFETRMRDTLFAGRGSVLTVCNATIGLMLALKLAAERRPGATCVVMPSFTFAAAAHAVLWAGLVPLLVDVDPSRWSADPEAEQRLLAQHGSAIAAVMPYATFGTCIDLDHYDRLADRYGVPVVVDAAASLGSLDGGGLQFGAGSPHMIVFSMHATKAFALGEAGLIASADADVVATLRRMGNFGFGSDRAALMPGLNSKISEVAALAGLVKLADFEAQIAHRAALAETYLAELPDWTPQRLTGNRVAYQFMPFLLPEPLAPARAQLRADLDRAGIGTGQYFVPPIHAQPYFQSRCHAEAMPNTDAICARMISLPMSDFMTTDDVAAICQTIRRLVAEAPAVHGGVRSLVVA